jgi:GH25 family lysozyme M1 (1,4-beta-N-acetylmuramidase)
MLRFMDVSGHQGHVDYARARRTPANPAGVDGVLVKLTEGADWRDPEGAANMAGAKRAGVPRGPYHYLRPRTDRNGATEARHAVAVAKELGWNPGRRGVWRNRDLPMSCDVEWENNVPQLTALGPVRAWEYVSGFCDEVERLTGRGCVFYSAPGFMPLIGGRAPRNASLAWIADPDSPDGRPRILAGFRPGHVRFHQTDFHGVVPGVGAHVDLDVFLGGQIALRALIAGIPVPTAPKPKPAPKPKVPADTLGVREVQQLLKRCGWPITVDGIRGRQTMLAVRDFQRGYGRERLAVDGKVGARTGAALRWSAQHDGHASAHFAFREFASSRTGWIRTHHDLVAGLEVLREQAGRPIGVLSGFRDFALGASQSQHRYGNAMDPTSPLGLPDAIARLGVFSGIGYDGRSKLVRHVDVRHVGPNTTGGTPSRPTIFADNF